MDPLRDPSGRIVVPSKDNKGSLDAFKSDISDSNSVELLRREWTTFKRFLVQKFPPSRTVAISSVRVAPGQIIYKEVFTPLVCVAPFTFMKFLYFWTVDSEFLESI